MTQLKASAAALGHWCAGLGLATPPQLTNKSFVAAARTLRRLMIRHTKDQQISGAAALALPALDARTVRVDMPAACRAAYARYQGFAASRLARALGGLTQFALELACSRARAACADVYDPQDLFGASEQGAHLADAKCRALRDDLRALKAREPHAHAVVFTQHAAAHKKICELLKRESWDVLEFSGATKIEKRHAAIRDFQKFETKAKVIVVTLRTGSVGITLTAATRLYLFEPCLDPSAEIQAAGRVHRLGLKHDVHVIRFVYKDTIEDAVCELHDKIRRNEIQIADGRFPPEAIKILISK